MASGGALIDSGSYGCIFKPALLCKNQDEEIDDRERENNEILHPTLSKLILKEHAIIEHRVSKMIHKIPLWQNYFAASESICKPAMQQMDRDLPSCHLMDEHKLSEFRILTMKYAGKPLRMARFNYTSFDFMNFLLHLLKGCALLNLHGIVHYDLHHGNVLVDTHNVPRIIDFNLAIDSQGDIKNNLHIGSYSLNYVQQSPDSILINAITQDYDPEKVISDIVFKKKGIKQLKALLKFSNSEMINGLRTFYNKSRSAKQKDAILWFTSYWRTIDSWAIGVMMVELIISLSVSPAFMISFKEHKSKIITVLKKLCAFNPMERIDAVQAVNYLEPDSMFIKKYGAAWLQLVGDGMRDGM
jgi:serine/threonine protein kinase